VTTRRSENNLQERWYSVVEHKSDQLLREMTDADWNSLGTPSHMDGPEPSVPHAGERRAWTSDEDQLLLRTVQELGSANWTQVAQRLKGRQPKQCRQRYFNKVRLAYTLHFFTILCPHAQIPSHIHATGILLRFITPAKNVPRKASRA
jgi:hypothetical protein